MSNQAESKFMNIFITVFLGMIGFGFLLIVLAISMRSILGDETPEPALVALADERIKPYGEVYVDGETAPPTKQAPQLETGATAADQPMDGEGVYQKACFSCHATGLAGAPKLGDAESWAPRVAQGIETLYKHSLEGFNAMPPKGGFVNYSDDQVKAAVDFMVESAQ